jgi:hypothetical protein
VYRATNRAQASGSNGSRSRSSRLIGVRAIRPRERGPGSGPGRTRNSRPYSLPGVAFVKGIAIVLGAF